MTEILSIEKLEVQIHPTRAQMGESAAMEAAGHIRDVLSRQSACNIIFAAAPSQNELLQGLRQAVGIDWNRVNAYHMDEYIGLPAGAPQRFGHFLHEAVFKWLPLQCVNYINGNAESIEAECERYAKLLADHPPDICFMGIGENGHIAFNDPPVADFEDPRWVKPVILDRRCRLQQVNDGCFRVLAEVPQTAITLTVPALMQAQRVFCAAPGQRKAEAAKQMLKGAISHACPASILRRHPAATLYLDEDSASLLREESDEDAGLTRR